MCSPRRHCISLSVPSFPPFYLQMHQEKRIFVFGFEVFWKCFLGFRDVWSIEVHLCPSEECLDWQVSFYLVTFMLYIDSVVFLVLRLPVSSAFYCLHRYANTPRSRSPCLEHSIYSSSCGCADCFGIWSVRAAVVLIVLVFGPLVIHMYVINFT